MLSKVNINNSGGINKKLDLFIKDLEKILGSKYQYKTGKNRNNTITKSDLVDKILEVYFQKRVLYKVDGTSEKKISELSSGEKRQALIDLVYAFLKRDTEREKYIILGIDEPELSLHSSVCYDQFEKLKEISKKHQILITTHWYGFLPIVSHGYGHFVDIENDKINFSTYDLYSYKSQINKNISNKIPVNFNLKSTNDLVQAIYGSIIQKKPYTWIICEGISEKIYFEYFFKKEIDEKKLRILPMGGQKKVVSLFKYLQVPMNELERNHDYGKILCLVDTDNDRCSFKPDNSSNEYLFLKRLSNQNSNLKTNLLDMDNSDNTVTDIEQALNPIVFKKTLELIDNNPEYIISKIENENGNTSFIKNFENYKLERFFKEKNGDNKIEFAKKYIKVTELEYTESSYSPKIIDQMKELLKL